jgi:small subunit ribosomal protein S20
MPITKSAKKSLKVSRTKAEQNKIRKIQLSKALKQVNEKNVNDAISIVDKAAKIGIIHENKAARIKSQLAKKYGTPKADKKSKVVSKNPEKKTVKTETKKPIAKKSASKKVAAKAKTSK